VPKALKSVTGKRSRCQYCDKDLVPGTNRVGDRTPCRGSGPGGILGPIRVSTPPRVQFQARNQLGRWFGIIGPDRSRDLTDEQLYAWHAD
jgi:hypothetical protein